MKKEKKESNFSKLMKYSGRTGVLAYLSWILAGGSAVFTLLPFWYIWRIVQEAVMASPDYENAAHMTQYAWTAALCAIAAIFLYILGLLCSHCNAFHIASNMRIHLIRHITQLPPGEKDRIGSGALRRIISDSSAATETYLAHQLPDQVKSAVMFIGLLILMFSTDWKLALICLIPAAVGFLAIMSMAGKGLRKQMDQYQNALSDMSNEAVEYVRGIPVIKIFGQTLFSFKRFKDAIDRYSRWASAYTGKVRLPVIVYTAAINSIFLFLLAAAKIFTGEGITAEFTLKIIFFVIISPVMTSMLTSLMYTNETNMIVDDAMKRMESVLAIQPLSASDREIPDSGSIRFEHVSYSYDGAADAVRNVSFEIQSGQTCALVGPSGGGKSTLAMLAARFFDPADGSIFIGGADIREIPKDTLMNSISFVFQDAKLIHGTILDNVRLGRPEASVQEAEEALEKAQCMDIIQKFPEGIHTVVGTEGVYLSGGEQQRLTIARALLKNAPILILDEATAFADPDNENRIQQALSTLARDKTVLMIAHRLSTIKNADQICVVREGQIVEQGTFASLKEGDGLFASMWKEYRQSVEWNIKSEVTV